MPQCRGIKVGVCGWVEVHPHKRRSGEDGIEVFWEWGKQGKGITFEM